MGFEPFTIDDSLDREQTGSKPYLERGDYLFSVAGISPSPEDHTGKAAYWRWKFRIESGPSAIGRTFPHTGTWSADSQWGNGSILRLVGPALIPLLRGKQIPDYKTFVGIAKAFETKLIGTKIGGVVDDDDPYLGRPQSQILEFYPAADFAKRSRPQAPPTAQAPTPARPTPNGGGGDEMADLASEIFGKELADL